jgi:hypothetical protein
LVIGLGVVIAAGVVSGVDLAGSARERVLAAVVVLLTGPVVSRVSWVVVAPVGRRLIRVAQRRGYPRSGAGAVVITLSTVAGSFGLLLALIPLDLWLGREMCALFDLPFTIAGWWPLIVASVVVAVTWIVVMQLERLARSLRGSEPGGWHVVLRIGLSVPALWLVIWGVGGVEIGPGQWWEQALVVLLLAVVFTVLDVPLSVTAPIDHLVAGAPLVAAYAVVANGLTLWLISWFSDALDVTLRVAGFGTFVVASLACTAVVWLASLPLVIGLWTAVRRWQADVEADEGYAPSTGAFLADLHLQVNLSRYGYRWPTDTWEP